MARNTSVFDPLAGKSASLFLVGGGLVVVFASLLGYQAFVDGSAGFHDGIASLFGPGGFALGFVGLLGLYPTLADKAPRLAGAGAVFATLGAVGGAVNAVGHVGTLAGMDAPAWVGPFALLILLGMVPGYLSFAAAVLRTDGQSRTLGLLLCMPAVLFVVMIVGGIVTGGTATGAAVLASGQALAHVAIGYTLHTDSISKKHMSPTDTTA